MATQEEKKFLDALFRNDGIMSSLEIVEKGFHQSGFTEKGKRVEQCTERNDVHFHAGVCCTASRPCMHLMSAVVQIPESENISIRTCGNIPSEGEDHTLFGC